MDTYDGAMKTLISTLKDHVPLGRFGTEAEVSSVTCFLLSAGAAYVTGVTISINGGSPLGSPLLPVAKHRVAPTFEGFHRAVVPDVLGG